jgi:putative membrane protein
VTDLPTPAGPGLPPGHINEYADRAIDHREWQRLDPLMLLVQPIKEIIRFLPALVGIVIAGNRSGGGQWWWNVLGIGIPIGLGIARYLTTSFRIAEGRVELRRGLLNKHLLSTPIDRVRTVDISASPIHRVVGLTTVRIGTGTASTRGDDELDLDGIRASAAGALRRDLLHGSSSPAASQALPDAIGAEGPADDLRTVVTFDLGWLRFAPFTSSGVIIAAALLGAASQVLDNLGLWDHLRLDVAAEQVTRLSVLLLVPVLAVGVIAVASVLAVAGYLITNFGFRLTHSRAAGVWHLTRGLLTTRETSIDDSRLRGVSLGEPLGLRLAGGARLSAIVTGLDKKHQESSTLVPPAPRAFVAGVASEVLGTPAPIEVPLIGHGSAARKRRYVRALTLPVILVAALVVGVFLVDLSAAWIALGVVALAAGVALAADRHRALGHALVAGHLVSRSGSLDRRRVALETQAVIGWTLTSTWFQRRAGLTTVVATMAGGPQSVTLLDVPEPLGVALARDGVPGLVEQFLA